MEFYIEEMHIGVQGHGEDETRVRYGEHGYTVDVGGLGDLFRQLRREHGGCLSRVYIDRKDGSTQPIGWVFLKWKGGPGDQLEGDRHKCETWCCVLERPPRLVKDYVTLGS